MFNIMKNGAPGEIRTPNLLVLSQHSGVTIPCAQKSTYSDFRNPLIFQLCLMPSKSAQKHMKLGISP
jgi:hypothetical protein